MNSSNLFTVKSYLIIATIFALVVLLTSPAALAQTALFTQVYDFHGGDRNYPIGTLITDASGARGGPLGAYPYAGLTFDSAGNLWGTTTLGGPAPLYAGVFFKLSPNATGRWTETVVHAFDMISGGFGPDSSITFNAAGKAFSTTAAGGALNRCTFFGAGGGCGLVFGILP